MFMRRGTDGTIEIIVANVTDDLLFAADEETMTDFTDKIYKRFNVSRALIDETINCKGCRIDQEDQRNKRMRMNVYMPSIKSIGLPRKRRKEHMGKATDLEYKAYRSLSGNLTWAGNGS